MDLIEILLLSLSLSVDSLVVSMSGSVTLGRISPGKVTGVALVFGITQAALLFLGWLLGYSVASFVHQAAHVIGFLILLYIGGSMIWSAFRSDSGNVDLSGIAHLVLAAIATSIDAFAVGVSLAMSAVPVSDISLLVAGVALVTALASVLGISCGTFIGKRFGKPAKAVGGAVLILIGVKLLIP